MAKKRSKQANQTEPPEQPSGSGTALLAGAVGSSMVSNAGGATITTCPPEDKSFYCNFVKGFNIFKMILFIIVVLTIAYVLYKVFLGSNGSKTRK